MCDEGRFGWKYIHADRRLTFPDAARTGDEPRSTVAQLGRHPAGAVRRRCKKHAAGIPRRSVAVSIAVDDVRRGVSAGEVARRVVAEGRGWRWARCRSWARTTVSQGRARQRRSSRRSLRSARRSARTAAASSELLKHFTQSPLTLRRHAAPRRAGGELDGRVSGGRRSRPGWITEEQAASLERVPLLIVQDLLPSPASRRATFVLSGGVVRREGRHVRESCRARAGDPPVDPRPRRISAGQPHPLGARRPHGPVPRRRACGRRCAKKIPDLAPLAVGDLGDTACG